MTPSRTWYNAASVLDHHGGDGIVGSFKLKTLAVSCSVPEPVTQATPVGGFGAVGGALRRRRRPASPAAA